MELQLRCTPQIEEFLIKASSLAQNSSFKSVDGEVAWSTMKRAAQTLREAGHEVDLRNVCAQSELVLKPPAKREVTPEFRKELEARRKAAEQVKYNELVKDVTGAQQKSDMHSQYLPTMKLQIGQGVHVAVTMGLGYALGSAFGDALSVRDPVLKALGGVVGLIVALIFETVLFITRASMTNEGGAKYMHLLDPKRYERMQQPATPAGEAFTTEPVGKKLKDKKLEDSPSITKIKERKKTR